MRADIALCQFLERRRLKIPSQQPFSLERTHHPGLTAGVDLFF